MHYEAIVGAGGGGTESVIELLLLRVVYVAPAVIIHVLRLQPVPAASHYLVETVELILLVFLERGGVVWQKSRSFSRCTGWRKCVHQAKLC